MEGTKVVLKDKVVSLKAAKAAVLKEHERAENMGMRPSVHSVQHNLTSTTRA